ncbi:MAG: class I SAM-dependent RNA methyltransferase [Treponema sp.]|nr:class I SAM-dependent RNA methyltransferase [Treponema sp.]
MNTLVALCAVGAEKILGNEIKHLGYKLAPSDAVKVPGRVTFLGDDDALLRSNLCLRTADRVFLQLAEFDADNFDLLFDGIYAIDWQNYFRKDTRVVVDKIRVYKSRLDSEHTIQSMAQKAIYKKLGDVWRMNSMPESGLESDVRIYVDNDKVFVLLDLSGDPLHKRGYRTDGGIAPMRETTAAILLQYMLWRRKTPLCDPFCGSGTIPIEAALYAMDVAPGLGRKFAVEELPFFDKKRGQEIRKQEASKIRPDVEFHIAGSDIDSKAVDRAKLNAEHACVMAGRALQMIGSDARLKRPDFVQADYKELAAPFPEGLLLANPPYGERIGDEAQAEELYRGMSCLTSNFENWQMGFITSNKNFQKCFGRYANLLKNIKSGNLNTCFYMYTDQGKKGKK